MAIMYRFWVEDGLLRVKASGTDENLVEVQRYSTALILACIDANCDKMLIDERDLVYTLDTLDTYLLAEYFAKNVPRVVRAAIVCHPQYFRDGAFWETAAVNRGFRFRVFTSIEKAEKWLIESD